MWIPRERVSGAPRRNSKCKDPEAGEVWEQVEFKREWEKMNRGINTCNSFDC